VSARELPLFPLRTVLFPGGVLPLRIFETRYVDLVRRCLKADSGFGVVLLVRGSETGGSVRATAAVGTEARIVDFDPLEDGLLGLTCVGQERIRVLRAWAQEDKLNVGEVETIAPDPVEPVPEDCSGLPKLLKSHWQNVAAAYPNVVPRFDEAGWVANRLAELMGLDVAVRQQLLETQDPIARLRELRGLLKVTEG